MSDLRHFLEHDPSPFSTISHPAKRAFLEAFASIGKVVASCDAAGISHTTLYTSQWQDDREFMEAYELAQQIATQQLVDEAKRRAVEGTRSYKFTKDGTPLRHPDLCDCGHARQLHARRAADDPDDPPSPGPCTECSCSTFTKAPYFEHSYSDHLLQFLLRGLIPETYGDKLRLQGAIAGLDLTKLPAPLLARIAQGEHPMAVLASAAEEAATNPAGLLGMGEGGSDPGEL